MPETPTSETKEEKQKKPLISIKKEQGRSLFAGKLRPE